MLNIQGYLVLSAAIFVIGVMTVLLRRGAISILMGIELMLNATNLAFAAFSRQRGTADGQIFVLFVIAIAAAEAAVGLAIVIAVFRSRGTVNIEEIQTMKH